MAQRNKRHYRYKPKDVLTFRKIDFTYKNKYYNDFYAHLGRFCVTSFRSTRAHRSRVYGRCKKKLLTRK